MPFDWPNVSQLVPSPDGTLAQIPKMISSPTDSPSSAAGSKVKVFPMALLLLNTEIALAGSKVLPMALRKTNSWLSYSASWKRRVRVTSPPSYRTVPPGWSPTNGPWAMAGPAVSAAAAPMADTRPSSESRFITAASSLRELKVRVPGRLRFWCGMPAGTRKPTMVKMMVGSRVGGHNLTGRHARQGDELRSVHMEQHKLVLGPIAAT